MIGPLIVARDDLLRIGYTVAVTLFLIIGFNDLSDRFENVWPGAGIEHAVHVTESIGEDRTAEWKVFPQADSVASIWFSFRPLGKSDIGRTLAFQLRDEESGELISAGQAPIGRRSHRRGWHRIDVTPTPIDRSREHRLSLSLPDTPVEEGIAVHYLANRFTHGVVSFGERRIENADIEHYWCGGPKEFPWPICAAGTLLLVLLALPNESARLRRCLMVAIASMVVLAVSLHYRDARVFAFFANYWPDGYMRMSQPWVQYLAGERDFTALKEALAQSRNGQVILFPGLIGLLQHSGVSPAYSYYAIVAFFTVASLSILVLAAERFGYRSETAILGVVALGATNPMLLRSSASLQTDIGGLFFSLLSVYLLLEAIEAQKRRKLLLAILTGLSIYLGVMTRISLAPLVALPLCAAIWSLVSPGRSDPRSALLLCVPTLISAALVCVTWSGLDLFGTIEKAREFSQQPQFRRQFSWMSYLEVTLASLQLAIVPICLSLKRYFNDLSLAAIAGALIGMLAFLAIAEIIPWFRYWAPIGSLGTLFCLQYFRPFDHKALWLSLYACGAVAVNLWLILSKDVLSR
jgi:hypothetical protein